MNGRGKPKYSFQCVTLSNINSKWIAPGLNPDLCGERMGLAMVLKIIVSKHILLRTDQIKNCFIYNL